MSSRRRAPSREVTSRVAVARAAVVAGAVWAARRRRPGSGGAARSEARLVRARPTWRRKRESQPAAAPRARAWAPAPRVSVAADRDPHRVAADAASASAPTAPARRARAVRRRRRRRRGRALPRSAWNLDGGALDERAVGGEHDREILAARRSVHLVRLAPRDGVTKRRQHRLVSPGIAAKPADAR